MSADVAKNAIFHIQISNLHPGCGALQYEFQTCGRTSHTFGHTLSPRTSQL